MKKTASILILLSISAFSFASKGSGRRFSSVYNPQVVKSRKNQSKQTAEFASAKYGYVEGHGLHLFSHRPKSQRERGE
jgi:hypothetical protein